MSSLNCIHPPAISNFVHVHLLNHMVYPIMDLGLLFPATRSTSSVGAPTTTATMLFRTMDSIPRDFSPLYRNPIECLLLPIPAVIATTTNYKLSPKLKDQTINTLFELQAVGLYLTPIPINRLPRELHIVTRRFYNALATANCIFYPFFRACLEASPLHLYNPEDLPQIQAMLQFASFRKGLHIQHHDDDFAESKYRTRNFRKMVIQATTRRLPATQVTSTTFWNQFWALFLNHSQRNVLYRLVQRKIPTKLYRLQCNPAENDPLCCLCLTIVESTNHLFFYCREKRLFWDNLIQEYLWPGTSLGMIIQSLISLNFNAIKVLAGTTTFKPSLILIVALSEVWKAHWRFIFDQIPLTSAPLFASFRRALAKVQSEKTLYTSSG